MESTSARNAQRKAANEDGKRHPNGEVDDPDKADQPFGGIA